MKKINYLELIVLMIFLIPLTTTAKPPKEILEQMEVMARINAAISTCIDSSEYKALRAERALDFHDLSFKIDRIIETIEKSYSDNVAYMAYKVASLEIKESSEFNRTFRRTYSRSCADQLLIDMNKSVRAVEVRVKSLIRSKK
jgi:hypothetical protein